MNLLALWHVSIPEQVKSSEVDASATVRWVAGSGMTDNPANLDGMTKAIRQTEVTPSPACICISDSANGMQCQTREIKRGCRENSGSQIESKRDP